MRTVREREVKRTLFTQEVRENVANHLKLGRNGKTSIYNGSRTDGSTTAGVQIESTNENSSWQRANGSHSRDRSEANSNFQISDDDIFTSHLPENLILRSSTPINSGESETFRNGSPPRDIVAFYRRFGDWYNIFPKTDYTYSKRSPWFGKEVAPGIPIIPNLSRPSLHGSSSISEKSIMNTKSSSIQSSRNSEKSYRDNYTNRLIHDNRKSERTYWETIVKTTTMTVTTTVTTITTYASNAVTKMHDSRTFLPIFLLLAFGFISYLLLFSKTEKEGLNLADTSISHVIAPYTKIFEYISSFFTSTFYLLYETISMLPVFVYQTFFGVTTFLLPVSPNSQKPLINQQFENVFSSHEIKIEEIRNLILQTQSTDREYIRQVVSEVVSEILSQKGYSDRQSLDELKQSFEGKLNYIQEKIETQVPSSNSAEIQTKDPNSAALSTAVLRQEIQEIVEGAINKYHADQTGMPDYALSSFGGQILKTKCTNNYLKQRGVWTILGYSIADVYNSPDIIIKPGSLPGECWAFEGSAGCVVIKLAMPIIVNAVTMEHTPKELTHHGQIKSAPKLFTVASLKDENDEEPDLLGRFTFLDNHKSLQTFETKISEPTQIIELKIESNHGHPDYTCLYRFRVHGSPVNG